MRPCSNSYLAHCRKVLSTESQTGSYFSPPSHSLFPNYLFLKLLGMSPSFKSWKKLDIERAGFFSPFQPCQCTSLLANAILAITGFGVYKVDVQPSCEESRHIIRWFFCCVQMPTEDIVLIFSLGIRQNLTHTWASEEDEMLPSDKERLCLS